MCHDHVALQRPSCQVQGEEGGEGQKCDNNIFFLIHLILDNILRSVIVERNKNAVLSSKLANCQLLSLEHNLSGCPH